MPNNHRRSTSKWTADDVETLRRLAAGNTPTHIIGLRLGRSERTVRRKACEASISLRPVTGSVLVVPARQLINNQTDGFQ